MSYRIIDEQDWQKYFNTISQDIPGGRFVEIGVAGSGIGDQVEEGRVPFGGISYDPREKIVHVHTEAVDHAISEPREVVAIEDGAELKALSIRDADGNIQSVRFLQ